MKYILSVILIIAAGFKLTTSFINPEQPVALFSTEVNVWVFRLVWLFAAALSFYTLNQERNKSLKK